MTKCFDVATHRASLLRRQSVGRHDSTGLPARQMSSVATKNSLS